MRKNSQNAEKSGIELKPPRLLGRGAPAVSGILLGAVLLPLTLCGTAWCFLSSFSLPVFPLTVTLYALLFCAVSLVVFHLKPVVRTAVLLALLLLFLGVIYRMRESLIQGFLITANQILSTYSRRSEYVFPTYLVLAKRTQYASLCTSFVAAALFPLALLLGRAVTRRSFWFAFLVTFPFLLAPLAFTITPNLFAVIPLFSSLVALLFMRPAAGRKHGFVKKRGVYRAKGLTAAVQSGLIMVPTALICFSLILAVFPQSRYRRAGQAETLRREMTDALRGTALFGGGGLAGRTDQVNLSAAGEVRFTGRTVLQVHSTRQASLYLKGYVGSVYTGLSWDLLSGSAYDAVTPKLNGKNVLNMSSDFFSLLGQQDSPSLSPFEIRVKNIGTGKQNIYAPYHLRTTPEDAQGIRFADDGFLRAGSLFGVSEYSLSAYGLSGASDYVVSPVQVFASVAARSRRSVTRGTRESISGIATRVSPSTMADYYKLELQQELLGQLSEDGRRFVQAEQDYRLFLYDRYTQLPDNIRSKIVLLLEQQGMDRTYPSVGEMADAVRDYLARTCSYTLTPGRPPEGRDFTDYFLFENRKGYCVHFATAGAVMLRAMGVPARYAEGYVVPKSDFGADGNADVADSRAHAWVEIYSPGVGWIPVDMTPGFDMASNRAQDNLAEQNESSAPESAPGSSAAPESSTPESSTPSEPAESVPGANASSAAANPRNEPEEPTDLRAALFPVLLTLAALAAAVLAAILRRRLILSNRAGQFAQKNSNRAALSIYAYLLRLARYGGEIPAEITEFAEKARFSQHRITPEELLRMKEFAGSLARKIYASLPKGKRFRFRYVEALI